LQTEIQEGRAHARSTSQSQLIAHPMEIYKVSMEEARWRAVFQEILPQCSRLLAMFHV